MSVFDSTGIEVYVKENNPTFLNTMIHGLKAFAKAKGPGGSFNPYKAAYARMPSRAEAEPQAKQQYVNGHFCYAIKAGIVSNGLGIPGAVELYDDEYFAAHPDIVREKKSDSPDEDKSVGDNKLLIPTLKDFFKKHPLIQPKAFPGDSAFDAIETYKALLTGDSFGKDRHFSKAFIPLNSRATPMKTDYTVNDAGIPCCPNDPELPMKPEGNTSHLRCGIPTFKFVCPKMTWDKGEDGKYRRVCHCGNPCTTSKSGRMIYIYPERNLRMYPGAIRDTDEWNQTYRIRGSVERTINHFKNSCCLDGRRTRNPKTLHADLLLCGITQLITVLLADSIHQHQHIRSLKKLVA